MCSSCAKELLRSLPQTYSTEQKDRPLEDRLQNTDKTHQNCAKKTTEASHKIEEARPDESTLAVVRTSTLSTRAALNPT